VGHPPARRRARRGHRPRAARSPGRPAPRSSNFGTARCWQSQRWPRHSALSIARRPHGCGAVAPCPAGHRRGSQGYERCWGTPR
jgi:hypothetical protein